MRQTRRVVWSFVAAVALALSAQIGHASNIPGGGMSLYNGSKLVFGDSASILQLVIPSAGVLSLTWTDLDFSSTLATLDVGLSNGGTSLGNYLTDGSTTL